MKQVICSCGYLAAAETAEELLTAVEAHIDGSHGAGSGRSGEAAQIDPRGPAKSSPKGAQAGCSTMSRTDGRQHLVERGEHTT